MKAICEVEPCQTPVVARGFCERHYRRFLKYGDPEGRSSRTRTPEERFWARVDQDGPTPEDRPDLGACWMWRGAVGKRYGILSDNGKTVRAHRFAYELLVAPIPLGLTLDHLCRVTLCCNPAHLEPVTPAENARRSRVGEAAARRHGAITHCPQGHPYDEDNTLWRVRDGYRNRGCRECTRVATNNWYAKKRLAEGHIVTPRAAPMAPPDSGPMVQSGVPHTINALRLAERDGWICQICFEAIDPSLSYPDPGYRTVDHIIPRAWGGEDTYANTRIAHLVCNMRRHDARGETMADLLSTVQSLEIPS